MFQPVWNRAAGRAPDWGIKDYDIFYFDPDISWQAEDDVIKRVAAVTTDLGIDVEVKNQARVHLWYEARFGSKVAPITSAQDGIGRFLIAGTCVGVALDDGALHAPYGLDDIAAGVLRPNPAMQNLPTFADMFKAKASAYQKRWPKLVTNTLLQE